ncbi:UNVERIFIED_CONTAM: hypothetical protein PYX00_004279 [Menopon gallinae]|uniref:Uncharacterized protein n=1 Tax=Menopon gallinae TaxID=328185 RepID=A0AAW2I3J4_9NEOP
MDIDHSGRRENDVFNAVIVAYDRCRRQLTSGGWAWACECPKNGDDCVCIDCLKNTENDWRNIEPEVDGNEDAGRRKPQQQDGSQKSEEAGCQQRRIRTYLSRILLMSGSRGGDRRMNRDGLVTRILKALRRRPEEGKGRIGTRRRILQTCRKPAEPFGQDGKRGTCTVRSPWERYRSCR